jgi:hypothetical protein
MASALMCMMLMDQRHVAADPPVSRPSFPIGEASWIEPCYRRVNGRMPGTATGQSAILQERPPARAAGNTDRNSVEEAFGAK